MTVATILGHEARDFINSGRFEIIFVRGVRYVLKRVHPFES